MTEATVFKKYIASGWLDTGQVASYKWVITPYDLWFFWPTVQSIGGAVRVEDVRSTVPVADKSVAEFKIRNLSPFGFVAYSIYVAQIK